MIKNTLWINKCYPSLTVAWDYPPTLLEIFSDQTLEPGPSVTLKCVAQGNPLPQIIWTLDAGAIPENPRFRLGDYVRTGRDSTEVVSYVNITSVRPEDGGLYECEASNDVGKATHSARLNVFGPPFVRSMSNMSVVAGETLRLQCPVGGHPIETIKWEKDGLRLPNNHRQKVFPNGTLIVRNVEKTSDSGPYKCSASNADGITAENSLFIKVIVKPLIEPFTFPKSLQTGQRFSVLCTITEGDPPIQIQWIKDGVQSLLSSSQDGVRSVVVTPFSTTLVFESLAPEHRGNYTCVASNAAGTMSHTAPMVPRKLARLPDSFLKDLSVLVSGGSTWKYNIGVPQGSFSGPVLQLLIIKVVLNQDNNNENVYLQAYVDKIALLMKATASYHFKEMSREIILKLESWAKNFNLHFNPNKTKACSTASTGALHVLNGCPPLDLKIRTDVVTS
ncbi:Down syndrome cell adhesion molecule-like protein Dscam2 [Araneus ventricosus]|uniref:Down syndrome cell adhesion molecule-like protein Dscam2 n=1 Tax=Araneus ventricosus TaxID=182803 RepID=A0A4Y2EYB0_ARAVE|nr:Down syndrome cell adhesion molecule-like protein Dscam2 [Araneus ventricosus]